MLVVGCATVILLSVTGVYGGMIATYEKGQTRTLYTLGMGNANALACMYLMLLALGIYCFSNRLRWYTYLFLLLVNIGIFWLTDCSAVLLATTLLLVGAFLASYSQWLFQTKALLIAGAILLLFCLGFSVFAAANGTQEQVVYAQINYGIKTVDEFTPYEKVVYRLDSVLTGRIACLGDTIRHEGTLATWFPFSSPENMTYYFDMGWVKVFYRYGIIPGALYCLACFWLLWRFWRTKDAFGLVDFSVLALYTVVEAHLVSPYIGRNFLLIMMGCSFMAAKPFLETDAKPKEQQTAESKTA